jgi:hypothetical protein
MTRDDYLLARGWRRSGAFPGGGDQWYDPLGKKRRDTFGVLPADAVTADDAERIQLDRDAAARDYVDARRPVRGVE